MKHNVDTRKFTVYKLVTDDKKYVAVPKEYVSVIEQNREEHGGIEKVPSDKTVRGIFLKEVWTDEYQLPSADVQQNDITINQLR
jgi:hypothetical protein